MIKVSYATMEAMGMLIQRLGQDARRLEKALAETMNTSAEWKRIADELKAERNAAKQEAVSARQDAVTMAEALGIAAAKEAGKLLGMVAGEGLRGAAERVIKERDAYVMRIAELTAELVRIRERSEASTLLAAEKKPARQHPVKVGEYVKVLGFRIRRTEVQRDKLRQYVDALKAERDAERKAHDEYKERIREIFNGNQRLTAELAVIKDERDALRAECDDLRRVFSMVHGSLGIQQGAHLGNAIDALKKERDGLMIQAQDMRAEIERLKTPPRQHPVKAGEYVRRLTGFNTTPAGEIAQVIRVHIGAESNSYEYEILRPNGQPGAWVSKNCTPCDPPQEASHDTPEGKRTAEGAVEPKPGDVVRLVRVPKPGDTVRLIESPPESMSVVGFGRKGDTGEVVMVDTDGDCWLKCGKVWPTAAVEIVKGADK